MSNRAHRRPIRRNSGDAAIDDVARFERLAQLKDYYDGHRTTFFLGHGTHDVVCEEIGPGMYSVHCPCGFEAPAPFGEQHAERVKEAHLFRYKVIADPRGAKYRA